MATLEARLIAVVQRIRDQFNAIRPRLIPGGGAAGQVLAKASVSDSDVQWIDPPQSSGSSEPGWTVSGVGTGASQNLTLPHETTAEDILVFVNGVYQAPDLYAVMQSSLTITAPLNAKIVAVKPAGVPGADGVDAIGIPDAPGTGKTYARKDGAWEEVTTGGASATWTEISSLSLVGQTVVEFSSISQDFSELYILLDNVKHNHTSNAAPTLAVQRAAVPTWWRSFNLFALGYVNTQIIAGDIHFPLYKQHNSLIHSNMIITSATAPFTAANNAANLRWSFIFKDAGPITGLRIAVSGGTFETGTATLFAR